MLAAQLTFFHSHIPLFPPPIMYYTVCTHTYLQYFRMATEGKERTEKESALKKLYLIIYNSVLAVSWSLVLLKATIHISEKKTFDGLYNAVELWLKISQTAALMEILHSMFGLVRSSVLNTLPQVMSRVGVLWIVLDGIVMKDLSTRDTIGFPMLLFAWTITEVIRYPFYWNALLGSVPYPLQWCRYSFFIVLYPLGVCGEIMCILTSLPLARRAGKFSYSLPNKLNISFDYVYFCYFVLMMYGPVFYQLYTYMLSQRRKIIGKKEKSS